MKFIVAILAFVAFATLSSFSFAQIAPPPASGNLSVNSLTSETGVTALQSGGNGVAVTPSASGGTPSIAAIGTNGNITLDISSKGAAGINLKNSTAITGSATVTGNAYVAGQLGSANNINAPSPTNSGITIGGSPTWAMASFYDQALTANNRTMDMLFISGGLKFRFANDARNAFLDFLTINGGQASGVTGVTSTSGSGAWAHTGPMTVSGTFQASGGEKLQTFLTAAVPNCSAGNTGLTIAVQDVGGTPAWNAILPAGTGSPASSTTFPVFCDGTNWRIH